MSVNRAATVCMVLALALVVPILAMPAYGIPYVSTEQQDQITADLGPGAPYGEWQKLKDIQTFYLHRAPDTGTNEPANPNQPSDVWYDTHLPPAANMANRDEMLVGTSAAVSAATGSNEPYLWVPGTPTPGSTDMCLGPPRGLNAQIPTVLDDTSIFRVKINFFGTPPPEHRNFFVVDFIDIEQETAPPTDPCAWDGNSVKPSTFNGPCSESSIGLCLIARVRAEMSDPAPGNSRRGAVPCSSTGQGTCTASNNAFIFESDWIDICSPLGGNEITPGCSPIYGYNLRKGHAIAMRIHAQTSEPGVNLQPAPDNGNLVLLYDTRTATGTCGVLVCTHYGYPSNFQIESDATRINMWSEDRFGAATSNYPPGKVAGTPTNAQDRTVRWKAVQVNTWGHQCGAIGASSFGVRDGVGGGVTGRADQCYGASYSQIPPNPPNSVSTRAWDGIEEFDTKLRIRDMNPSHTGAGYCRFMGDFCYNQFLSMDQTLGLQGGDPGQDELRVGCCNLPTWNYAIMKTDSRADSLLGIQRYSFNLPYPAEFQDGQYRIEFQDEGHRWNALYTFFVGGAGFDFRFKGEPNVDGTRTIASHLVALGEPTKYSMILTNNGVTTDTYALAVPTPGGGWTATVSPTSVTLPPKAFANIDVTVFPPDSARAGDIKVVSVTAASPATNQVQTLFTRTTYTALKVHDVFLTSPTKSIELRPGLLKLAPVTVHNNGTIVDAYVLTASGMPAGWSVSMTPSFMTVFAASREDVILNVKADAGAQAGESFTLRVTACKSDDNSICGFIDIPVTVYPEHRVAVETLPGESLTCWTRRHPSEFAHAPADVTNVSNETLYGGGRRPASCTQVTLRDAEWDYRIENTNQGTCNAGYGTLDSCYRIANRDTKFDDSAIFRVKVMNLGDAIDKIELTGAWDAPVYHPAGDPGAVVDSSDCDDTDDPGFGIVRDGVPDGWRFRVLGGGSDLVTGAKFNPWDAAGNGDSAIYRQVDPGMIYPTPAAVVSPRIEFDMARAAAEGWDDIANPQKGSGDNQLFAGEYSIGNITLPPRTSQYVYVELMWMPPLPGRDGANNTDDCDYEQYVDACGEPTSFILACVTDVNFRPRQPSPNAYFRLAWRSGNDASFRGNLLLHAHLAVNDPMVPTDPGGTGEGSRSTVVNPDGNDPRDPSTNMPLHARYNVLLERGLGQPDEDYAPLGTATPFATFNFVATNLGNEYDNLKIDVDDGKNGWSHTIAAFPAGAAGTGILGSGDTMTRPTPPGMPTCTPPGGDTPCIDRPDRGGAASAGGCPFTDPPANQHMICYSMGVGDNVNFQVRCRPPSWARPGDYNDMTVTVTSDRANVLSGLNTFSRMTVRCIAQGPYSFDLESLNGDLLAYRTQTIAFPFTIHNTGLNSDRYFVALDVHTLPDGTVIDPKEDPWNPQTSSGAIVHVPAGFRYHGFLSVTVPDDAEITAEGPVLPGSLLINENDPIPDHRFRLKIQSLDGPGQESKTIDLTAIVIETPAFTVHADPVTIASGAEDRIRIKAVDCEPGVAESQCSASGLTSVEFNGYYIDADRNLPPLPRGFAFTCLQGDTDGDGYSDRQEVKASEPQPIGEGIDPLAWSNQALRPTAAKQVFASHPNFDKFRGCYLRPETIPGAALPNPADVTQSCFPTAPTTPPDRPPCGAHEYHVTPTFAPSREAIQQLEIKVPEKQLGVSRVAHRIEANAVRGSGCGATDLRCRYVAYTDAIVNMKTVYGVSLNVTNADECGPGCRIIPPGKNALGVGPTGILYNVVVENTGLSPQSVLLTHSALPQGWELYYGPAQVAVQPPGYLLPGADPTITEDASARQACLQAQPCIPVEAQDRVFVEIGILAPANAKPGASATVLIFGTVQEDTTKVAQLQLTAKVGTYNVEVEMSPATYYVQPDEPARFTVTVRNTGDVKANFDLNAALPASVSLDDDVMPPCPNPLVGASAASKFTYCFLTQPECNFDPNVQDIPDAKPYVCYLDALEPNETRQVVLEVKVPPQTAPTVGSSPGYLVTVGVRNALSAARGNAEASIKVLDYQAVDVDFDGAAEYAIDSCTVSQGEGCLPDPTNGYETFREAACLCGIVSREAPIAQYLEDKARVRLAGEGHLYGETYFLDANNDKHADHLIDTDGDTVPDVLWIPDEAGEIVNIRSNITYMRDVTGDQLPDLFLDAEAPLDGNWDLLFDMAKGRFVPMFQAFADGDEFIDYIIDADGDGEVDDGETILLGGPRGAVSGVIFKRDMDGDGKPELIYDLEGDDGIPEHFILGTCDVTVKACDRIDIVAKDVTGDNRADWTFDNTGKNGRPNAYYDPTCEPGPGIQCYGMIDTRAQFLRDLVSYWFIGALFLVALVLFVALLVVTRRR
jgi:hypothetical protein